MMEYYEAGLGFLLYIGLLCIWWRRAIDRGEFD